MNIKGGFSGKDWVIGRINLPRSSGETLCVWKVKFTWKLPTHPLTSYRLATRAAPGARIKASPARFSRKNAFWAHNRVERRIDESGKIISERKSQFCSPCINLCWWISIKSSPSLRWVGVPGGGGIYSSTFRASLNETEHRSWAFSLSSLSALFLINWNSKILCFIISSIIRCRSIPDDYDVIIARIAEVFFLHRSNRSPVLTVPTQKIFLLSSEIAWASMEERNRFFFASLSFFS